MWQQAARRGLSPGDLPWYFVDSQGKLHRLGWRPTPTHRDTDIGALVCGRDPSYLPSRYCTFDHTSMTLSPLDFLPPRMVPLGVRRGPPAIRSGGLDADGRVWAQTAYDDLDRRTPPGGYRLAWTDDDGATWHSHPIRESSSCAEGHATVVCEDDRSLDLSVDRGATWSKQTLAALTRDISAPGRRPGRVRNLLTHGVTASGAVLATVGDLQSAAVSFVRRPPGPRSSFIWAPVTKSSKVLHPPAVLTTPRSLLFFGSVFAPIPRSGKYSPRPAVEDSNVWLTQDDGSTWTRYRTRP